MWPKAQNPEFKRFVFYMVISCSYVLWRGSVTLIGCKGTKIGRNLMGLLAGVCM